ncbi:MAG: hypothetical protein LBK00_08195 [Treponema sp.]|jgi:hypothetical protein|nr:hypothetical protein [Treponema sp.]
MGPPELGILCVFLGLPAITLGFVLGMKYLNNKKLEIEKEMQQNKIKLLEEENKKYDNIIKNS